MTVPKKQTVREAVLGYQHPALVKRLCEKESKSQQEAETLVSDMLRFLFLCGTRPDHLAPTEAIDVAWHHFILFTRDYRTFCNKTFGTFIDHNPISSKPRKGTDGLTPIARTLMLAKKEFGNLSRNWAPKASDCIEIPAGECAPSTNCQDKE